MPPSGMTTMDNVSLTCTLDGSAREGKKTIAHYPRGRVNSFVSAKYGTPLVNVERRPRLDGNAADRPMLYMTHQQSAIRWYLDEQGNVAREYEDIPVPGPST